MNQTQDRRKTKRRSILDHFSFYVNVPKLGSTRLNLIDVSEMGIGFEIETLGEFRLAKNEECELNFYLNQSLFLPLKIQVTRLEEVGEKQKIGAVFLDTTTQQHATFLTLVKLLDQLVEFGVLRT